MAVVYIPYDLNMEDMPGARLFLLDVPAAERGAGLLLDRFGWVVAEDVEESAWLQVQMACGDWGAMLAWSKRTSAAPLKSAIMLLPAPQEGQPYLVLCRWHPQIAALALQEDPYAVSRGRYSLEGFAGPESASDFAEHTAAKLIAAGFQPPIF